jgi:hypothetical protein
VYGRGIMRSRTVLLLTFVLALPLLPNQRLAATPLADKDMKVEATEGVEKPQGAMPLEVSNANSRGAIQEANAGELWTTIESDSFHRFIEAAAIRNDIPIWFLTRLIRQESGFNPQAVSPAGAMGIAQFMPATAAERGLVDPLDPAQAIPKSAELLKDLKGRFGNLGLAAAAYNAGPQRVQTWLSGRGGLPLETRSYVLAITGRPVQDWAPPGTVLASLDTPALPKAATAGFGSAPDAAASGQEKLTPGQDGKLKLLLQAEAEQSRSGRARRQARAVGEQSLCSLMNSMGSTCIIQKTY